MAMIKKHIASIAALCAVFALAPAMKNEAVADGGEGSKLGWLQEDYPYLVVDQALSDTLSEFGRNLGVAIDVSNAVDGRVRHYRHNGSSGEFLKKLASEHRFDWVFDQGRLFISSSAEKVDRSWPAGAEAFDAARSALSDADIHDPRYPIGFDSDRGELNLSAPPRYMALAAPLIDRMLAPKPTQAVNVIHGRARAGGT
ncbi:MAG: hypothetical protein AAGA21_02945 [Pseudomonadota bacterium]